MFTEVGMGILMALVWMLGVVGCWFAFCILLGIVVSLTRFVYNAANPGKVE